jgi:metal-responsive CopG/Arc/MetJ family transcriptional regulator
MSVVISIRIPKKLKEKIDSLRDIVNWSDEIRKFLEDRVREYHRMKVISEIHQLITSLPEAEIGTAAEYMRDDRDRN